MLGPSVLDIHTSGLSLAAFDAKKSSASIATPTLFFFFLLNWTGLHPSLCFCFQMRETPTAPWTANQKWPRGDESICQGARTAHAAATANNKEALRQRSGGEVRNLFLHSSQSSRFESLIRSLLFPHVPAGGKGLKIPQQRLCLEVFPCSPSLAA